MIRNEDRWRLLELNKTLTSLAKGEEIAPGVVEQTREHIDRLLYGEPVPERVCSMCGIAENETEWGLLVDVRVITSEGEEGHADITQLLCSEHLEHMHVILMGLGFKDHRHGGINFLEDEDCPGYENMADCPTPSEYGNFLVLPQSE